MAAEEQHSGLDAHSVPIGVAPQIAGGLPTRGDAVAALTAVHLSLKARCRSHGHLRLSFLGSRRPHHLTIAQLLAVVTVRDRAHHGTARGRVLLAVVVVLLHVVHPVLAALARVALWLIEWLIEWLFARLAGQDLHAQLHVLGGHGAPGPATCASGEARGLRPIGGRARAQRLPHGRALCLVLEGEEHQGEGSVDGARRQDIWPFI